MVLVAIYGWGVHGKHAIRKRLPKELIVGPVFAVGTGLPSMLAKMSPALLHSVSLLMGLFTINCLIIAKCQLTSDQQQGIGSAVQRFPSLAQNLPSLSALLLGAACTSALLRVVPFTIAMAVAASSAGLFWVAWWDKQRAGSNKQALGHFADYFLLSPWLWIVPLLLPPVGLGP